MSRVALALLLALAAASAGQAQQRPRAVCHLPALDAHGPASLAGAARRVVPCPAPTARFEVDYTGFPAAAERAFAAAVETWSCRIASDVPIRIEASWTDLAGSTLGSAGPFLVRNFDGAPVRNTWYAAALADAIAGESLDGGPDIQAEFNRTFGNWHFDPGTVPAPDEYDLYTVVLHELAHGLGFIGGVRVENGVGVVGGEDAPDGPFIYDRFTRDASGTPLLALPAPSTVLADVLRSSVTFGGAAAVQTLGGAAPLYAPDRWQEGASYSHLEESAFATGTPDGLMTPFIGRGETVDVPGGAVCAVLADMGWTLSGGCASAVGPLEPMPTGLAITRGGANPTRSAIRLVVESAVPVAARVTLVDVLGRRVAELFRGVVGPGDAVAVQHDVRDLAPGSYLAVVEAEGETRAVGVTVVR